MRTQAQAPAAAAGFTTIDLADGTSVNGSQFDGSTSWGESSTVVAAATHGRLDSGGDAGMRYSAAIAVPANATGLIVKLAATAPGSNTTGGIASILWGASYQTTIASQKGAYSGLRMEAAGTLKGGTCVAWHTGLNSGTTLVGAMTGELFVHLADDAIQGASAHAAGATSGNSVRGLTSALSGTYTDNLYLFVGVEMVAASPSATHTWSSVVLSYQFVE